LEDCRPAWPAGIKWVLIASAALGLLAAQADFQQAAAARKSAELACARYASQPGRVWFEGHWGFQYYMQSLGAWPLNPNENRLQPGDILVVPFSNVNTAMPDEKIASRSDTFEAPAFACFCTMDFNNFAGFYSQNFGPLPFAFGRALPEMAAGFVIKSPSSSPR